jgi:S1-C subfamily serine protease
MRIQPKVWTVIGAIMLVGLGAGLAGFRVGAAASSTPAAMAQTPAPPPSVITPRQSYADIVDRVAPAVVTVRSARRIHGAQQFPVRTHTPHSSCPRSPGGALWKNLLT